MQRRRHIDGVVQCLGQHLRKHLSVVLVLGERVRLVLGERDAASLDLRRSAHVGTRDPSGGGCHGAPHHPVL